MKHLINLTIMGRSNIGKSSLCMKFMHKSFSPEYDPTQLESYTKDILNGQGKLVILDTAGDQKELKSIKEWVMGADGFMLVYSINEKESLEYIEDVIEKIWLLKERKDIPIVLIGNRCDLEEEREITKEEGKKFAKHHNCHFIETSAKLGINVQNAFDLIIQKLLITNPPKKQKKKKKGLIKSLCSLI